MLLICVGAVLGGLVLPSCGTGSSVAVGLCQGLNPPRPLGVGVWRCFAASLEDSAQRGLR